MKGFFESSVVQREAPASLVPRCGACGLLKTCRTPKMEPYGEGRDGVLVVGEAPGEVEDEDGRPFVGKSGEFLRRTLSGLGINLDRAALTTNALICRPPNNKIENEKRIDYCRPNLLRTIQEFKPRVILTLGRTALESVVGPYWKEPTKELGRWVGWQIPLEQHWICPTYHPSYLMRQHSEQLDALFERHLEAAFGLEDPPPRPRPCNVRLLYGEDEIDAALHRFDRLGGWVAFDYETNCLKPECSKARIVCCSVSNGMDTVAYPWAGEAVRSTAGFLRSGRTRKIASNLKFEDRWTRQMLRQEVANWGWDTMLAAHCLDNRRGICGLKFQAFVHLGVPSYNDRVAAYLESHNGPYNRIEEIAMADLLTYCGMDSLLEYRLAMRQRQLMGYED